MTRRQVELAARMMRDKETSIEDACAAVGGVGRSTLYRDVGPSGTIRQMPTG